MEISVPIPVKTDPNTVNYKLAKGADGVIVLMADLCLFHRVYTAIKPEFNVILKISRLLVVFVFVFV